MGMKAHEGGIGNIYYVCQTANTIPYAYENDYHQQTYLDGTSAVQTTITLGLAQTVAERNDYVIVHPDASDYDEGATLTMNKAHVHLICPAGLGASAGAAMRAATIDPAADAHAVTITGRGVEVAGFWIRGYAEKYTIYVNGHGAFVHHNDCAITSTTSASGGIDVTSSGVGAKIERNYVFTNAGTSDTIAFGIRVNGSASRTQVIKNRIAVFNGNTMTHGITVAQGCAMGIVDGNVLSEGTAGGGITAGTFTAGITVYGSVLVSNNTIGITDTSNAIVGGEATSCVNNICSLNGGTIAA